MLQLLTALAINLHLNGTNSLQMSSQDSHKREDSVRAFTDDVKILNGLNVSDSFIEAEREMLSSVTGLTNVIQKEKKSKLALNTDIGASPKWPLEELHPLTRHSASASLLLS